MEELNLPFYEMRIRQNGSREEIYDPLRRKFVALTPEEWVRQHFVAFLVNDCGYPAGLMGNEVSLTLNGTRRRCDTVVFSRNGAHPLMIVEYKASDVPITQAVFDQIVRYDMVLQAPYLTVSNGLTHYCCAIDYATRSYRFLPHFPTYQELNE